MSYDLIVIGSGPGGYVAAIRAGQLGMKTAIIEKHDIGGMCLNWGCIPTKALMESAKRYHSLQDFDKFGIDGIELKNVSFNWGKAVKRADRIKTKLTKGVEFLLKKNGVEIIKGTGIIESANSVSMENRMLEAKNIIIATGSRQVKPEIPVPDENMLQIWEMLQVEDLPQNIVVYGEGPNALELAQILKFTGREVSLVLASEEILPGVDAYINDFVEKKLKKDKISVFKNAKVEKFEKGALVVDGQSIIADKVINATKRQAVLPESKIDIALGDGFVGVNEFLQTNHESIFAVGDVNGKSALAHAASAQGLHAVNYINGVKEPMDHSKYPLNIYTHPEIALIGKSEKALEDSGEDYKVSEFPLSVNGKAQTEGQSEGLVRIFSEKKYGEVLGVQIIADQATDMIAEAATLMTIEGTIYDIAHVIHAHPTVSEVFMEAGFEAVDQAIHK